MRTVDLASQVHGETGKPIVILHGLLGSGRNWATLAKRLGENHKVYALDLRNHGHSPWADEMSYEAMAADVRSFIETEDLGPVILIGHSMGGKTAMRLALDGPSMIEKLVIADIAPVNYQQSFGSYVDAMKAIDVQSLSNRNEIDDLLALSVQDGATRAFLLQNLVRKDEGFSWKANLDGLHRAMPALMGFPSSPDDQFNNPTIFLAGSTSNYVQPAARAEIGRLFPKAEIHYIENAGHWLHAEQPAAFLAHLQGFLAD